MSDVPKPQAPLDVDAVLGDLEGAVTTMRDADAIQTTDAEVEAGGEYGGIHALNDMDTNISALEQIHTELTRELNQARA